MSKKTAAKAVKTRLHKDISSLKKFMSDYKAERKTAWKSFKNKINDDIKRLKGQ